MRHARHTSARLSAVAMTIATASLALVSTPASAHPFIADGGRVAVHSLATIALDLAHGCGDEQSGAGRDTDEVALEAPAWLRIVDVPGPDGWTVTVEDGATEGTRTVIWTATTGAQPAPRFTLDVVVDGEEGQTRYLRVSQRCGDRIERWIGTPDAPAEQPAVRIRLIAADPTSPPPPAPTPAPAPTPTAPPTAQDPAAVPAGADEEVGPAPGPRSTVLVASAAVTILLGLAAASARRRSRRETGTPTPA